ncbi:unnamed protein product [Mytilus edulis]|uniref:DDE-1 domain-containing protein n=1 Tax=Mytilus edulis TaxID=6550 RepID=A0A8S3TH90_MYTED|nr:unnamed protein product [Mytilus edulis]
MDIIETARNSDVHLFVLPPHSSHMLQPLDVSVFSPFKKSLNSEFHKQMHENPNSVITREQLPGFINTAYNSSMTVSNIMSGFRKTGIFPYNPEVVLQKPKPADPVPSAAALSIMPTRKERKDMRSIKVLFENKVSKVEEALKPNPNKKRRSTFVPPFGAAITEETFRQLLEEKNQQKVKPKQTVETRPTDEGNFPNKKSFRHPLCQR